MPAQSNHVVFGERQLAEGVREFVVDVHQPTADISTLDDHPGFVVATGPRVYRVEITCSENVFVDIFNRAMRDSKNAPDVLAAVIRHVEVPE